MLNELKRLKKEFMSESMKPYRKYMLNSLIFAVIVGTSFEVGPSIVGFMREKSEAKHYEENVWIEAEKANQTKQNTNKVDIAFNSIDTPSKMYRAMEETAIDMAERAVNLDGLAGVDSQIVVAGEKIPSEAFVTVEKNMKKKGNNISEIDGLKHVGGIYLRDGYIGKFIGTDGTFGSIVAQLKDGKVYIAPRLTYKSQVEQAEELEPSNEIKEITEEQYLNDIYTILETVYSNKWSDSESREKALALADIYFTDDCKYTLTSQSIGIDKDSVKKVEKGLISVGKHDILDREVNRIYVQLEMDMKGTKDGYVDFELKLNENNKIYDIDIL